MVKVAKGEFIQTKQRWEIKELIKMKYDILT